MALFIQVTVGTMSGLQTRYVNADLIRQIIPAMGKQSVVYFDAQDSVTVSQSPDELHGLIAKAKG